MSAGEPAESDPLIGDLIGNYRIMSAIGRGGMGSVYLGQHEVLGRHAAVKVLLPEYTGSTELVGRFFKEARATAGLRHHAFVEIFDSGRLGDGSAYLVMEYLRGESLAAYLRRNGRLPFGDALAIARDVAEGVGFAHEHNIVHRDLKPDNVYLAVTTTADAHGQRSSSVAIKVLDFGIAKLMGETDGREAPAQTRTGAVLGTPLYMSPEQCRGAGGVDQRADLYAFGCMVHEMFAGQPPFPLDGFGEIISAHLFQPPPPLRSLRPEVPEEIEALVLSLLAKKPTDRPPDMAAVGMAIDSIRSMLSYYGGDIAGAGAGSVAALPVQAPEVPTGDWGPVVASPFMSPSPSGRGAMTPGRQAATPGRQAATPGRQAMTPGRQVATPPPQQPPMSAWPTPMATPQPPWPTPAPAQPPWSPPAQSQPPWSAPAPSSQPPWSPAVASQPPASLTPSPAPSRTPTPPPSGTPDPRLGAVAGGTRLMPSGAAERRGTGRGRGGDDDFSSSTLRGAAGEAGSRRGAATAGRGSRVALVAAACVVAAGATVAIVLAVTGVSTTSTGGRGGTKEEAADDPAPSNTAERHRDPEAPPPPPPPVQQQRARDPDPPPPPPPRAEESVQAVKIVSVKIDSDPSGASVVDLRTGDTLGRTPLARDMQYGRDGLRLALKKGGYRTKELSLSLDQDVDLNVKLDRKPAAANPAATPPDDDRRKL